MMQYQTKIASIGDYGMETGSASSLSNNNGGNSGTGEKIGIWDGYEEKEETQTISRYAMKPLLYSEPNPSLKIPPAINDNYVDLSIGPGTTSQFQSGDTVPVFWHILKAGGTSVKGMYGRCFKKVEAAGSGKMSDGQNDVLEVFNVVEGGIRYVNGKKM